MPPTPTWTRQKAKPATKSSAATPEALIYPIWGGEIWIWHRALDGKWEAKWKGACPEETKAWRLARIDAAAAAFTENLTRERDGAAARIAGADAEVAECARERMATMEAEGKARIAALAAERAGVASGAVPLLKACPDLTVRALVHRCPRLGVDNLLDRGQLESAATFVGPSAIRDNLQFTRPHFFELVGSEPLPPVFVGRDPF